MLDFLFFICYNSIENGKGDQKMNREILFRGKRVDNDEWVYGFLRCGNYIDVWTPHTWKDEDGSTGEYATVETYQVDPETVGQYIGLKDRNGNKIFENGYMIIDNKTYKVIFDDAEYILTNIFYCDIITLKNNSIKGVFVDEI